MENNLKLFEFRVIEALFKVVPFCRIPSSNPAHNLLAGFFCYKVYNERSRMRTGTENVTQTMQTLYDCIVKAVERGYYESFKVISKGLTTPDEKYIYNPSDITISSLYKCKTHPATEGPVLYLIKTADGRKGTLIHSRSSSSDLSLSNFIQQVYSINRTGQKRKFWFNFLTR